MTEPSFAPPNSALLQDDLLFHVAQVVEEGFPIGPGFLHALNCLIEAVVLHPTIFCDPSAPGTTPTPGHLNLNDSTLIQSLTKEGVLVRFPESDIVDNYLQSNGVDYTYIDFLRDHHWRNDSFSFKSIAAEAKYLRFMAAIAEEAPALFQLKTLTDGDTPIDPIGADLVSRGMPIENLILLEGHNHTINAYVDLSRLLGLNLYIAENAMPHHVGAIHAVNNRARELYVKLTNELITLDADDSGETGFQLISMPELTRTVLARCKGDIRALGTEIMQLREKHSGFRNYLNEYDQSWKKATSKKERLKLQATFDNSWKVLLEQGNKPKDRIIYKLWDILKKPTEILSATGDMFANKGRSYAVVGQVRGFHAFWNELLDAPVAAKNHELLSGFGIPLADEIIWSSSKKLSETVRGMCIK
jgi:hypothetical protein